MNIVERKLGEVRPYEKNPRRNDDAVQYVAESIRQFGFKVPLVIDNDGVIVAGHTRWKAAKKLGLKTVPCIIADDLTDEQVKAFRLADNKVAEKAEWDFDLLAEELEELFDFDMAVYGFGEENATQDDWFSRQDRFDNNTENESDEYNEFLDKFEQKKTTDDCYTPDVVYNAVAEWVAQEYGVTMEHYVRPFFPGGDYQNHHYPEKCVVVDNPPFSILAGIIRFYCDKGIKFFLFAPGLTIFTAPDQRITYIPLNCSVTYANGAVVSTSFITNLEKDRIRSAPELYSRLKEANDEVLKGMRKELKKHDYPDEVITASSVARYSKYGVDFRVPDNECVKISALDEQKETGDAIFGGAYLVSERLAAERAAAERAAAERAAAERAAANKWTLSAREQEIVRTLGRNTHGNAEATETAI